METGNIYNRMHRFCPNTVHYNADIVFIKETNDKHGTYFDKNGSNSFENYIGIGKLSKWNIPIPVRVSWCASDIIIY